ncbi:thiamine phosphate synthase [bacterium]|nr:thiamine phosphate synthase [bacterium]
MGIREHLDISAYLVIGPENTLGRPIQDVIGAALQAGFTCVQVRSKVASARELIACCDAAAREIARAGRSDDVALLVDDRLDVVLAAREAGIKVDGVHVGQKDIPVEVCRRYVGEEGVVGLSARADEMLQYVRTADTSCVDYFGVGPLHPTKTKPDCGLDANGDLIVKTLADITALAAESPVPIVVGGGVKAADIPGLVRTGAAGFFVVSAVCAAPDPLAAARELTSAWRG